MCQTVARNNLSDDKIFLHVILSSGHAFIPLATSDLIAVDAYDVAALAAHPVYVEESGAADVANLPHSVHGSLPCHLV